MSSSENRESGDEEIGRSNTADLQVRMQAVHSRARRFMSTLVRTKASSAKEIEDMRTYFAGMRLKESGYDGIRDREVFFAGDNGTEGYGEKMERDAIALYEIFMRTINDAEARKIISADSKRKWIERFENKSVGFKKKEYWVRHQMPHYIQAWENVSAEQRIFASNSQIDDLVSYDPAFAALKDEKVFLALHYEKRVSLIAKAKAALLAGGKLQLDLYAEAEKKLEDAAAKGILAKNKVGIWLERIFKKGASADRMKQFLHGAGPKDLWSLMDNWADVRKRYDEVAVDFRGKGNEELPRGIHLITEAQFLNMDYDSRLHYVEDLEKRLGRGPSTENEPASLIKIRHAMDTRDWGEALLLIAKAKNEGLADEHLTRLKSMENYVKQFAPKKGEADLSTLITKKDRLDELLHQVPSSLQPMIMRLLRGPNANRSINQFRWIAYNNVWCRTHGYLNQKRAFDGASEDKKEMTKFRAKQGMDIGRDDSIDTETAHQQFFRKKEFANHKATYLHVNLDSGAPGALAEWLEHEQDPKVLYWTTFCGHEDGIPMTDNWHNDLFAILTEMRSITRSLDTAGYRYRSPHESLALAV